MSFQKLDLNDRTRPGGRNVVFLYGFTGFDMDKIQGTIKASGIDGGIYVDNQRKKKKLKELIEDTHNNDGVVYSQEKDQAVVFQGVSQFELQQFLNHLFGYMKEKPLIAMVTPTSIEWMFESLIIELKEERKSLGRG